YIAATGQSGADDEQLRVRTSVYEVISLLRMALHSWRQLKPARLELAVAVLQDAIKQLPELDY
ncbi:MAG TPA: hypothetical protein VFT99_00580, partial [Roseiflexaceae bacterium]|nr:hypothetical protein [Roseiflexaceae bacterium]